MRMAGFLALLLGALAVAVAGANTFTAEGTLLAPIHGYTTIADRWLINDGSFEGGTCLTAPIWSCATDNGCDWIADLVPLGLWNYDGIHVAWLGGFCGGIATEYTSICQVVDLSGGCGDSISWWWMAYVNEGGSRFYVTVDGNIIYEYIMAPEDHLLDYQIEWAFTGLPGGVHELCFHYDRDGAYGDNYFLDVVETTFLNPTATEARSFSVVKSLY